MKTRTQTFADVSLNVLLPLLTGAVLYLVHGTGVLKLLRNHLPDGLWAYAFISFILIVWQRCLQPLWIIAVFLVAIAFDSLQALQVLSGAADWYDIVTYLLFFTTALGLNKRFKIIFRYQN